MYSQRYLRFETARQVLGAAGLARRAHRVMQLNITAIHMLLSFEIER